jgi:hypothetical protein
MNRQVLAENGFRITWFFAGPLLAFQKPTEAFPAENLFSRTTSGESSMMTNNEVGLGGYQSWAQSGPRRALDAYRRKCELRAELAAIECEIAGVVEALTKDEISELQHLLAAEFHKADSDVQALAKQVEAEAKLCETVPKPITVDIPRRAVAALVGEARRRVSRGIFSNSGALVSEAVCAAYGDDAR